MPVGIGGGKKGGKIDSRQTLIRLARLMAQPATRVIYLRKWVVPLHLGFEISCVASSVAAAAPSPLIKALVASARAATFLGPLVRAVS